MSTFIYKTKKKIIYLFIILFMCYLVPTTSDKKNILTTYNAYFINT